MVRIVHGTNSPVTLRRNSLFIYGTSRTSRRDSDYGHGRQTR